MRILVTGAAGYIGSVLCDMLCQNPTYEVTGLDNLYFKEESSKAFQYLLKNKNFTPISDNILNYKSFNKFDTIFHLAADVGMPLCKKYPLTSYNNNVNCTKRITDMIYKDQRLIYPMTTSGYGVGSCDETSPLNPLSEYGKQKCEAETYVLQHMNSVSLRLATVCGVSPRMRFDLMVNDFVRRLKYEGRIDIYEPKFKRNFVHILDVCRCMIFMINPAFTGVYNIGFPNGNISKLELAYAICDILGYDRKVITVGEGKDVDQRDCVISTKKILATKFTFEYNLVDAVKQVAALCNLLSPEEAKLKGNV